MTETRDHRRVLHGTCRRHGGPRGVPHLVVPKERGTVMFDPHVDGSCVVSIDDADARELHQALGLWLG